MRIAEENSSRIQMSLLQPPFELRTHVATDIRANSVCLFNFYKLHVWNCLRYDTRRVPEPQELEPELTPAPMTQKPVLRVEEGVCGRPLQKPRNKGPAVQL